MENAHSEDTAAKPAEGVAAHADKKILAPTLGKVVEQINQHDVKKQEVGSKFRRRFVGKFEAVRNDKKTEKPAIVETTVTSLADIPEGKLADTQPTPEAADPTHTVAETYEIPLSEARGPAEAYIDLRREEVAAELHRAKPDTPAQAEAAADATLLGRANEQLATVADNVSFNEAIDRAQTKTMETLSYPASAPAPIEIAANTPPTEFVRSYLEQREQSVRAVANEQFSTTQKAPEYGQVMPLTDLLAYAERIVIDGVSLKAMFESRQITEPGLRRIAAEHLKGADVEKALQKELLLKEMTFERDPQMRDRIAAGYASVDAASPQATQDAMTKLYQHAPQPRPQPTAADQQADSDKKQQYHDDSDHQTLTHRLFITAWALIILVLCCIAGWLILR